MDQNIVKEYLLGIGEQLKGTVKDVIVDDSDGEPVLLCAAQSPFAEDKDISYTIWFEAEEDSLAAINILIILFENIPDSNADAVRDVVNRTAQYLTIGGFAYLRDSKTVAIKHAFYIDPEMTIEDTTVLLANTILSLETAVSSFGGYIFRAVNGESPEIIIEQLAADIGE